MLSNKILVFYSHFLEVKVTKGNERQKRIKSDIIIFLTSMFNFLLKATFVNAFSYMHCILLHAKLHFHCCPMISSNIQCLTSCVKGTLKELTQSQCPDLVRSFKTKKFHF